MMFKMQKLYRATLPPMTIQIYSNVLVNARFAQSRIEFYFIAMMATMLDQCGITLRGERKNRLLQNYCFFNYPSTGEREILIG